MKIYEQLVQSIRNILKRDISKDIKITAEERRQLSQIFDGKKFGITNHGQPYGFDGAWQQFFDKHRTSSEEHFDQFKQKYLTMINFVTGKNGRRGRYLILPSMNDDTPNLMVPITPGAGLPGLNIEITSTPSSHSTSPSSSPKIQRKQKGVGHNVGLLNFSNVSINPNGLVSPLESPHSIDDSAESTTVADEFSPRDVQLADLDLDIADQNMMNNANKNIVGGNGNGPTHSYSTRHAHTLLLQQQQQPMQMSSNNGGGDQMHNQMQQQPQPQQQPRHHNFHFIQQPNYQVPQYHQHSNAPQYQHMMMHQQQQNQQNHNNNQQHHQQHHQPNQLQQVTQQFLQQQHQNYMMQQQQNYMMQQPPQQQQQMQQYQQQQLPQQQQQQVTAPQYWYSPEYQVIENNESIAVQPVHYYVSEQEQQQMGDPIANQRKRKFSTTFGELELVPQDQQQYVPPMKRQYYPIPTASSTPSSVAEQHYIDGAYLNDMELFDI